MSELLVNEIGDHSGEVRLPDRTLLVELTANGGAWLLSPG
jgi:hypothetical protein